MNLTKILIVGLFVSVTSAGSVAAQAPTEFIALYNITVKSGQAAQFEEFMTKLKAGADKIGAAQHWGAGQVTFGGPGNTYVVGLPFEEWKDMDAWTQLPMLLMEAYGKEEGAKILAAGNAAIDASETTIGRHAKELSYNADATPGAMVHIRSNRIHRGKQDQYRIFVQALNEAWEQAGDDRNVIRRTNVLGDTPVYTTARWFNKWEDLEGDTNIWDLIEKAHGETAARRLRVLLQESVAESSAYVVAIRPDLSRLPAANTSN